MTGPVRTLVVSCQDWPVRAWGIPAAQPAAVLERGRISSCSPAAREAGVTAGLRKREAQARCPDLEVLARDEAQEARRFEPVVTAVAAFTPLVEIARPGVCAIATRGPSRYFGGDQALASKVAAAVRAASASAPAGGEPTWSEGVGVADGFFAASWAAQTRAGVVPPGASPSFVAPLPLTALDAHELVQVLWQLGLRTLGDFAALPEADVLARFGTDAARRHRWARGLDERPLAASPPPQELAQTIDLDPPAERVEQAAFAVKTLADRLHDQLAVRGLACSRVLIEAETEHGERLSRLWRHEGALTAAALADRVRWQLEGWLSGSAATLPTGGLSRLALVPEEVLGATGRQLGFWGGQTAAAERAARAATRVAGMLGPDAVSVVERQGGRSEGERYALVSVLAVDLVDRSPQPTDDRPWPGVLPVPPASFAVEPETVELVRADGQALRVNGRGEANGEPAQMWRAGHWYPVKQWAGPWPVEERWWDAGTRRRQARYQVVVAGGGCHLLTLELGLWRLAATWD
jgi:protein ImuB